MQVNLGLNLQYKESCVTNYNNKKNKCLCLLKIYLTKETIAIICLHTWEKADSIVATGQVYW